MDDKKWRTPIIAQCDQCYTVLEKGMSMREVLAHMNKGCREARRHTLWTEEMVKKDYAKIVLGKIGDWGEWSDKDE